MHNEDQEIWKVFPDYPWVEVSNLGRVRTKDRMITDKNGRKRLIKGRVLKQWLCKNGYMYVTVSVSGKGLNLRVNRMVAIAFIPNPHGYPEVNHKDNNPKNNVANNLEWCTKQYNLNYKNNFGTSPAQVQGKPVIVVNLDSFEVFWFKSQCEAARQLSAYVESISRVVKGKLNKTGGYWFCYADENAVEKTRSKFGDEIAKKVEELMNENNN